MKTVKVIFACLLVIGGLAFLKYRSVSKAIAEHANFSLPPESVTSTVAKPETWQKSIQAIATIVSTQGVTLKAEEAGKVVKINFDSGSQVKAGDVLIELDTSAEDAQLRSAAAKLELARVNLARAKNLRPTNAVSQSDLDTYTFQTKQLEADAAAIRAIIAKKQISAPFNGRMGIRMVNVGQFVMQGDPIVPLHSLDPLYVNFNIPQQQIGSVSVGQIAEIHIDAFPEMKFEAKVTAINPQVDQSTRNSEVQATLANPEEKVRPGMYASATLLLQDSQKVFPIPGSAVAYAPYGNSVYIIEPFKNKAGKDSLTVRQQFVKLGPTKGDLVGVVEGLQGGEQLATSGLFKLRPGGEIVVNNIVTPGNSTNPKPADT